MKRNVSNMIHHIALCEGRIRILHTAGNEIAQIDIRIAVRIKQAKQLLQRPGLAVGEEAWFEEFAAKLLHAIIEPSFWCHASAALLTTGTCTGE